jgi:hypothetical protein
MLRTISVGAAVLALLSVSMAWAQNGPDEPAFPFSKWTIRWDYSCPSGTSCSFVCPAAGQTAANLFRLYSTNSIQGNIPTEAALVSGLA